MSDKRYYTPELSEFRVGFEYELQLQDGTWVVFTYDKYSSLRLVLSSVNNSEPAFTIEEKLEKGQVRVKHLDHDDIIAEGWKRETTQQFSIGEFGDLTYCDLELYGDGKVDIDVYEAEGRDANRIDYSVPKSIRGVTICNRSELRFTMKMLGIKQQ